MDTSTFFSDQWNHLSDAQPTRKCTSSIVAINSLLRNRTHELTTSTLQTTGNFLWSRDGKFYLVISNPYGLVKDGAALTTMPQMIQCIVGRQYTTPTKPYTSIGGIPAHELLYDTRQHAPIWEAQLTHYDEDSNAIWYSIQQLVSLEDGEYGGNQDDPLYVKHVLSIQRGYPNPNHYCVQLGRIYRNITKVRMISSEFPPPTTHPINGRSPSYYCEIRSSRKQVQRTVHLDHEKCTTDRGTYNEFTRSLQEALTDVGMYPCHSTDKNPNVALLQLEIPESRIISIHPLDTGRFMIEVKGAFLCEEEEPLYVQLSDSSVANGFYRVVEADALQVQIRYNGDPSETPPPYTTIYQEDTLVGHLLYHISLDTIQVVTEYPSLWTKGVRLNLGPVNAVFEVISIQSLGASPALFIEYIGGTYYTTASMDDPGVYNQDVFSLHFPPHSILSRIGFQDAHVPTKIKYGRGRSFSVAATLRDSTENTSTLEFPIRDIPSSRDGYDIISIQHPDIYRKHRDTAHVYHVIAYDIDDIPTIRIYLREEIGELPELHPGQWVTALQTDHAPQFVQLDRIEVQTNRMTVYGNPLKPLTSLYALSVITGDYTVTRRTGLSDQSAILTDHVLRGSTYISTVSSYPLQTGFIVQIGKDREGHTSTTGELNVIMDSRDGDDSTTMWKLKHPITNSRLKGTPLKQLYLYVEISARINKGDTSITIVSPHLDLEDCTGCMGCINWLSNHLGDDSVFVEEEPIRIVKVVEVPPDGLDEPDVTDGPYGPDGPYRPNGRVVEDVTAVTEVTTERIDDTRRYRLILDQCVGHTYTKRETYVVLFINPDLTQADPSTVNYSEEGKWYTAVGVQQPMTAGDRDIFFYGVRGDDIPVYGLSKSDHATRSMQEVSLGGGGQLMSDLMTAPVEGTHMKVVTNPPSFFARFMTSPYLVIEGRITMREGSIRHMQVGEEICTDISRSNIRGIGESDGDYSSVQFATSKLPTRFRQPSEYKVTVRPRSGLSESVEGSTNFSYFYICCPSLGTIHIGNHELDTYKALDGWSFLNKTGDNPNELDQRSRVLSEYKRLGSVFNKIQIFPTMPPGDAPSRGVDTSNILFNSYVHITTDRTENPIQELDELEFTFLWPNGHLVDFGGLEHSFTLEVTEEQGTLNQVDSRTGATR